MEFLYLEEIDSTNRYAKNNIEKIDDLTVVSLVNKPIATIYDQFLVTSDGEYILYM